MSKVEDRLQASNGIWDAKWDAFEMDIVSRETNKAISELKRIRSILVEKDKEIEELRRRLSKKILHLCVCEDIDRKDKEIAELKEIVEQQDAILDPQGYINEQVRHGTTICVLSKDNWHIQSIKEHKKKNEEIDELKKKLEAAKITCESAGRP